MGEKSREFVKEERERSEWVSVKGNEEGKEIELGKGGEVQSEMEGVEEKEGKVQRGGG